MFTAKNLPQIDGLRGLACMIVLVFHAAAEHTSPHYSLYLTGSARVGVWLFFVLSAFLLTLRLFETGTSRIALLDYSVARVLRIIPLFALAVLVYHALGIIGLGPWLDVVKALSFQKFYNHLWTIPIEFQFYFLLPLLFLGSGWLVARLGPRNGLGLIFLLVVVAGVAFAPGSKFDQIKFHRYIPCFMFGVLAAFAVRYLPEPSRRACASLVAGALATMLAFTVVMKSGALEEPTNSISGKYTFFGFLWALATYGIYSADTIWSKILQWKPLARFGLTIYSTYLFHWIPMHYIAVRKEWWAMPAAIGLSIVLGAIGYLAFERPLHRLRQPVAAWLAANLGWRRESAAT